MPRSRGTGFRRTPFASADALSDALGFDDDGGVWVKDETGNVAGSHKARHLVSILLHLKAAELDGRGPEDDRLVDLLLRQRGAGGGGAGGG